MNWDEIYEQGVQILEDRSVNVDITHRCLLQCPFCSRQSSQGPDMVKASHAYGDLKVDHARDLGNTFKMLSNHVCCDSGASHFGHFLSNVFIGNISRMVFYI